MQIPKNEVKKKNPSRKNKLKRKTVEQSIEEANENGLLQKLKEWVNYWYGYYNEHIQAAREHLLFLYVDQWEFGIRNTREANGYPTMQFNHVRTMIDAIVGSQRKNSPQVSIRSLKEGVRQDELDWTTDLFRQIAYESDADSKYQTCFKHQLICGWGFLQASVAYKDNKSLKRHILIEGNKDYQVAFFDPSAQEKYKQDGDYCGIYKILSKEDFSQSYPDIENPVSAGQTTFFQWQTRETVTVCDIYYKEYFDKTVVRLSDGSDMELSEALELIENKKKQSKQLENSDEETSQLQENPMEAMEGPQSDLGSLLMQQEEKEPELEIVEERKLKDYTIKHVRFIENAILEQSDWPGKFLPLIFVEGDMEVIDGRENPISFINDMQDPQRMYNYMMSEMALGMISAQKTKIMGTQDMFKGFEQYWRQPQKVNGVLPYNPDPRMVGGKPEIINPPPFNEALLNLQGIVSREMSVISGRYEETRGEESNAISGVAIKQRKNAGNNVVNAFEDNLLGAIVMLGKVVIDLVPHVYGGQKEVTVRNEQGVPRNIAINKKTGRYVLPKQHEKMGMDELINTIESEIENEVSEEFEYDIEVKAAGSFDSQMQEQLELLLKLGQIMGPDAMRLMADIIAGSSNIEKSKLLQKRLSTLLPPDIKAEESGAPPPPPPPPDPMVEVMHKEIDARMKGLDIEYKKDQAENQLSLTQLQQDQEALLAKERESIRNERIAHVKAEAEIIKADRNLQQSYLKQGG